MTLPKQLIIIAAVFVLVSASHARAQGRGDSYLLTFEGTLLKFSPHSGRSCGVLFVHQVAKYHVDRVLSGKYVGHEIVVDHPACDEDVFKNVLVGSHGKITVRVWHEYLVTTMYPGIRGKTPNVWYVAESSPPSMFVPPTKIDPR